MLSEGFVSHLYGAEARRLDVGLRASVMDDGRSYRRTMFTRIDGRPLQAHPHPTDNYVDPRMRRMMAEGLCRGDDPDLWFRGTHKTNREAKETCRLCPAVTDCLSYALGYDDEGVWGGYTRNERRELRSLLMRSAS